MTPCVCTVDDGLVQEWVQKAREVAKGKGFTVGPCAAEPEVCICAAIRTAEGQVIRGHRHSDAFRAAAAAFYTPLRGEDAQGFITSRGRFVDRREGRQLQEAAGIGSVAPGGYRGDLLFSEDLY